MKDVHGTRGQTRTENIDLGYEVLMNDFYQTGEDGQIGIIFVDDTSVTVIENSELMIDDFVYDPATNAGELAFNVTVGSFRYVSGAIAANNEQQVKITTPSATITVRGTTLTGNVTSRWCYNCYTSPRSRWRTRFGHCG